MKETVWILGGTGMLGESLKSLVPNKANFRFLGQKDFSLGKSLKSLGVNNSDVIIDLIPPPFPRQFPELDKTEYHRRFTEPHVAIIQEAAQLKIQRYVYVSSGGAIYGKGDKPHRESDPLEPVSFYGESKKSVEEELKKTKLTSVILRPSNIYNSLPGSSKQTGIIGIYRQRFQNKEAIEVFGDKAISKDFIASTDVARSILLSLEIPQSGIFNVGSGETTSIGEIIQSFESAFGYEVPIVMKPFIANDVTYFSLDMTQAKSLLKFESLIKLKDWIKSQA